VEPSLGTDALVDLIDLLLNAAMISIYAFIAYTDFSRWKITNSAVLALSACGLLSYAAAGFDGFLSGLLAGALFFGITFPFWLARLTGAGDVKLIAVTGFVIGFDDIFTLAVLMLAFSVLMLIALRYAQYVLFIPAALNKRLTEILQDGRVPYGVPISLAAVFILSMRLLAS
jgi:prepilin peptidase CpaA